tara:strand:+ start:308 stop:475 length:168 start_codon:yes stop_codon:yes gene_type:complete
MISTAIRRSLLAILLLAAPAMALTACEEQGPLEKAGEKADEAVKDAGRAVKDATD